MTDLHDMLATLRRPRLLIRAARCGQGDYNRARDLKRLMRQTQVPTPEEALRALIAEEATLEAHRREGGAQYNLTRHLELLIAMMAEARLLPRPGA